MNLTMIQRMISEVSNDTLIELLVEYGGQLHDKSNEEITDSLRVIDGVVMEMKSRYNVVTESKPKGKRDYAAERQRKQSKMTEESKESSDNSLKGDGDNDGSLRTQSGKFQSGESGTAGATRLGNETE